MNKEKIAEEMTKGVPTSELKNLAKIGMIALVDEATDYQGIRPKDELRKLSGAQ